MNDETRTPGRSTATQMSTILICRRPVALAAPVRRWVMAARAWLSSNRVDARQVLAAPCSGDVAGPTDVLHPRRPDEHLACAGFDVVVVDQDRPRRRAAGGGPLPEPTAGRMAVYRG
jgi:hypothetical protein